MYVTAIQHGVIKQFVDTYSDLKSDNKQLLFTMTGGYVTYNSGTDLVTFYMKMRIRMNTIENEYEPWISTSRISYCALELKIIELLPQINLVNNWNILNLVHIVNYDKGRVHIMSTFQTLRRLKPGKVGTSFETIWHCTTFELENWFIQKFLNMSNLCDKELIFETQNIGLVVQ